MPVRCPGTPSRDRSCKTPSAVTINPPQVDASEFIEDVRKALYASKIVAYAQGFDQIRTASEENGWAIDLGQVATIWRGGCIIRARFLNRIREAYDDQPDLPTLLAAPYFADAISRTSVRGAGSSPRRPRPVCRHRHSPLRLPTSTRCAGSTCRRSLIQGLRDNFGAHTYRRTDKEGSFHTLWAQATQEEVVVAEGMRAAKAPGTGGGWAVRGSNPRHPACTPRSIPTRRTTSIQELVAERSHLSLEPTGELHPHHRQQWSRRSRRAPATGHAGPRGS